MPKVEAPYNPLTERRKKERGQWGRGVLLAVPLLLSLSRSVPVILKIDLVHAGSKVQTHAPPPFSNGSCCRNIWQAPQTGSIGVGPANSMDAQRSINHQANQKCAAAGRPSQR
eukprot:1160865-Pelagomonas_calceolata.AAC.9